FQLWYPDDKSEDHIYMNSDVHGATLSHVCVDRPMNDFLKQVFDECEHSPHFHTLSAVEQDLWPVILIACRHYRLPIPLHLWKGFHRDAQANDQSEA
ncbi:MAG: hypothetical protein AAGH78_02540, partial [Cyanobacteria bacterium P01_H01_bin.58]